MIVLPLIVTGSVFYAGSKVFRPKIRQKKLAEYLVVTENKLVSHELRKNRRDLIVSLASLKLATAAVLLRMPLLGIVSAPLIVYVFIPTFKEAGLKLTQERRINDQVLVSVRVTVCVLMGYTFIAALDAVLHSVSHKLLIGKQEKLRQQLQSLNVSSLYLPDNFHTTLIEQSINQPSQMQQLGEQKGEQIAPWMLIAFTVAIPLLGVNRAAAFLTTTFGSHLRKLGPYTSQQFSHQALQQGILLTQSDALDRAIAIDTIVFDGRIINDVSQQSKIRELIDVLHDQYTQVTPNASKLDFYVLVAADADDLGRRLLLDLHLDGYFTIDTMTREKPIEQLQNQGRKVCYIGSGEQDEVEMQTAWLSVFHCPPSNQPKAIGYEQLILLSPDLSQLPEVFNLANTFKAKQDFNLATPIKIDLLDISTTLFLDFGLIYSVLFTYTGLLLSMANVNKNNTPKQTARPNRKNRGFCEPF